MAEKRRWETKTLDALRTLLMFMVFLGHFGVAMGAGGPWYFGGQLAVNSFMSISMSTMVLAYYSDHQVSTLDCRSWCLFFAKRFARIMPLFYAVKLLGRLLRRNRECTFAPTTNPLEAWKVNITDPTQTWQPFTSIATSLDWFASSWITGGANDVSAADSLWTTVHLWFVPTILWLYALMPLVTVSVQSTPFRLGRDTAWTLALTAITCAIVFAGSWNLNPLLGVDPNVVSPFARRNMSYLAVRQNPFCRVFAMGLTVKATLAITRGEWVPSKRQWCAVFASTIVLLILSIHLPSAIVLKKSMPHASMDTFLKILLPIHQFVDFASVVVTALAAPVLIFVENDTPGRFDRLLAKPHVKLLSGLSRYAFSFYMWQFPVLQLVSMQTAAIDDPTAPSCIHRVPLAPSFEMGYLPNRGFLLLLPAVGQLLFVAVLSHYFLEEPSNNLLKRLAERCFGDPAASRYDTKEFLPVPGRSV